MNGKERTGFRRDNIGFIFQQFNLVAHLAAPEAALPDAADGAAAVAELERLLSDSNPEAMAWLELNGAALRAAMPAARATEIHAAVHACDLDDAPRLLREAVAGGSGA